MAQGHTQAARDMTHAVPEIFVNSEKAFRARFVRHAVPAAPHAGKITFDIRGFSKLSMASFSILVRYIAWSSSQTATDPSMTANTLRAVGRMAILSSWSTAKIFTSLWAPMEVVRTVPTRMTNVAGKSGQRCSLSPSMQGARLVFMTTDTPLRGAVKLIGARVYATTSPTKLGTVWSSAPTTQRGERTSSPIFGHLAFKPSLASRAALRSSQA
mmetsp:Transcript_100453/g.299715  ORF Transcript_100453/g.299715 Transcript_100453/m.299715 type:complete len:213 (-) Transcript_100453:76-714(-)